MRDVGRYGIRVIIVLQVCWTALQSGHNSRFAYENSLNYLRVTTLGTGVDADPLCEIMTSSTESEVHVA